MLNLPEQYGQYRDHLDSLSYSSQHEPSGWGIGPRAESPESFTLHEDTHPELQWDEATVTPTNRVSIDPLATATRPYVRDSSLPALDTIPEGAESTTSDGDNIPTENIPANILGQVRMPEMGIVTEVFKYNLSRILAKSRRSKRVRLLLTSLENLQIVECPTRTCRAALIQP